MSTTGPPPGVRRSGLRRLPRLRVRRPGRPRIGARIGPLTRRALTAGAIALAVAGLAAPLLDPEQGLLLSLTRESAAGASR